MNRGLTVLLNNAHFEVYLCASFASRSSSPKPSFYWSLKTLLTLANVIGIRQGSFLKSFIHRLLISAKQRSKGSKILFQKQMLLTSCKGGSRGRVQGVRTNPPEMTCGFLIQLVFCKKKKKNYVVYWC